MSAFLVSSNATLRRWSIGLHLIFVGCNGHGDDGDDPTSPSEDERRCEAAEIEVVDVCFFPNGVDITDEPNRPSIMDIPTAAVALDGGFYLPKIDSGELADHVGFVLEDNASCRVSCLFQCQLSTQSLCVTELVGSGDASPAGCFFCGEVTPEECQEFISACE